MADTLRLGIRRALPVTLSGVALLQLGFLALAGPASAQAGGNNGSVKIETNEVDDVDDANADNHPKVGCDFSIEWYGFDEGSQSATVGFEAHAPSGSGPVTATTGATSLTFVASGDNAALDHTEDYRLDTTGLTAIESQGYHVKVTVTTTNSQGSDTKSKVFWVAPCPAPSQSPSPSPSVSESASPSPSPSVSASVSTSPSTSTSFSPESSISPSVLGVKIVKTLPRTGPRQAGMLALVGALLVALGAMATMTGHRGAHARRRPPAEPPLIRW